MAMAHGPWGSHAVRLGRGRAALDRPARTGHGLRRRGKTPFSACLSANEHYKSTYVEPHVFSHAKSDLDAAAALNAILDDLVAGMHTCKWWRNVL